MQKETVAHFPVIRCLFDLHLSCIKKKFSNVKLVLYARRETAASLVKIHTALVLSQTLVKNNYGRLVIRKSWCSRDSHNLKNQSLGGSAIFVSFCGGLCEGFTIWHNKWAKRKTVL